MNRFMLWWVALILVILFGDARLIASDRNSRVFGGYLFEPNGHPVNSPALGGLEVEDGRNRGWNASVRRCLYQSWLGITVDGSVNYGELRTPIYRGICPTPSPEEPCPGDPLVGALRVGSSERRSLMLGPEVFAPRSVSGLRPFVRVLVGATHQWASVSDSFYTIRDPDSLSGYRIVRGSHSSSSWNFTWATGGGADLKVSDRIWLRPMQLDFIRIRHYRHWPSLDSARRDISTLRISSGLVVAF